MLVIVAEILVLLPLCCGSESWQCSPHCQVAQDTHLYHDTPGRKAGGGDTMGYMKEKDSHSIYTHDQECG